MINWRSEKGELMILFSFVLIILLAMVGIASDYSLYMNRKDRLLDIAYLIKDTRYDLAEPLFQSENPEIELKEIADNIAIMNGVNPNKVDVKWEEDYSKYEKLGHGFVKGPREALTKISIEDEYDPVFLKMFNVNNIPIRVHISDELVKNNANGYVWSPK